MNKLGNVLVDAAIVLSGVAIAVFGGTAFGKDLRRSEKETEES